MTDCISLMSDNFEILEEIFEYKYRKFVSLYWLISEYSDCITSMKYKNTKKETLKIDITLSSKVDKLVKKINKSNISEDSQLTVDVDGDTIKIEITKQEENYTDDED